MVQPCYMLTGKVLDGGWVVKDLISPPTSATGGNFCAQYVVEDKNGKKAFLKALDFSSAFNEPNWIDRINELTSDYIFERDIHEKCKEKRLTHVVIPLSHGQVSTTIPAPMGVVFYIIFEIAEGDLSRAKNKDVKSAYIIFKNLHGVSVGLGQLHRNYIAHQDVKPSNVLVFPQQYTKVADLGRACDQSNPYHWDELPHAGDITYAPFEKFWRIHAADFYDRYLIDMFMLGNLIFFYFLDVSVTTATFQKTDVIHPNQTNASFVEAVPYLVEGFVTVLGDLKAVLMTSCPSIADDVVGLVTELCHPDPARRGNPQTNDRAMKYGMQRYISKFDILALKSKVMGYVD